MQHDPQKIKRILIYRCGTIGDTIVSLPAINALREHFKTAEFFLMTAHNRDGKVWADDVLREFGWFKGFVTYASSDLKNPGKLFSLILRLRAIRSDLVVHLASDKNSRLRIWRDRMFFPLSGAKGFFAIPSSKISFWGRLRRDDKIYPNEVLRLTDGLKKIGIKNQGISFDLPIANAHVEKISQLLSAAGFNGSGILVGMCPWSKQQAKRWPTKRFAELGRRIIQEFGASIAIVGGQEEARIGEEITRTWPQGKWAVFAGRLGILETAELLRRCVFYVGNDTGAMHLAAAVGTSCVAIFSAKDPPESWHPFGKNHVVLRKRVPCRYCYLTECHENNRRCLTEISVATAFNSCKKILPFSKSKAAIHSQTDHPYLETFEKHPLSSNSHIRLKF